MSPGGTPSLACVFQLFLGLHIFAWVQNVPPKLEFAYEEEQSDRFYGNGSHTDHFKLLHREATTALIGARNIVYNISLANLTEFRSQRIVWQPSGAHRELCYLKGKSEDDCHNYIRIGAKISDDKVHLCGTNAYKPLCRTYRITEDGTELEKESEGQGWCPYDPSHNSTAIYADGQLYTATVADFSGVDPLIYREPLRTERSDLKQLNEPNFVSSMMYKDYVLFFFRETAVEYINCGKVIYSRVARVCKHDKGGPHSFGDRWTSFLKSRLNCSVPGDYPFYFNEIQSTSEVVSGRYGSESAHIVYGVFTTPGNSIGGSAICAFNVDNLMDTFEGPFKEQASMNENWLKVPLNKVPKPRPGRCVTDSRTLPDTSVNFVKAHSLMDSSVPPFFQYPLLMRISWQYRFTAIAVDPQVKALNGNLYDVMFVGTDDGRVIKAINVGEPTSEPNVRSVVIEELQVCRFGTPVRSLSIVRADGMEDKLLIVSDEMVQTLPLHRCSTAKIDSCWQCVQLQDPYCAWDSRKEECTAHAERAGNKKHLVQNVVRGAHKACPQGRGHIVSAVANAPLEKEIDGDAKEASPLCPKCASCSPTPCKSADGSVPPPPSVSVIYSADTLSMAVATSVLATLVVGFVAGYLFSRHFRHDNNYTNMPLHSHHQLNRLTEGTLNAEGSSYLAPCANNAKPAINLVLNVPPKNANGKNANSSTDNKPIQKVKKTYI